MNWNGIGWVFALIPLILLAVFVALALAVFAIRSRLDELLVESRKTNALLEARRSKD